MPFKQFDIEGIGPVKIYKRRGSRSLRLTINPHGEPRVSIPTWAPFSSGVAFAKSRQEWIATHQRTTTSRLLRHGQTIGKAHRLIFVPSETAGPVATRIQASEVRVSYPGRLGPGNPTVQQAAMTAGIRALRKEAEQLLAIRLRDLSRQHGYTYKSLNIKRLKGRWGSCDQDTNITLNLFLMQLPWSLIDYVILHELAHTRVLHHGADFWQEFESHEPRAKQLRKQIRQYQPTLVLQEIQTPVS